MNIVFKRKDFKLCNVPVPKGYPQSQTHAGIFIYNGKYYLSTSPYPSFHRPTWEVYICVLLKKLTFDRIKLLYAGGDYENPCIYVGDFRDGELYPTHFKLLDGSPLMEKPKDLGYGSYNSDPDLLIDNDKFYILNRSYARHPNPSISYTHVYLIEGHPEGNSFIKDRCEIIFDNEGYKSPCICKHKGEYLYFTLDTNSYNDGLSCKSLFLRKSKGSIWEWGEMKTVSLDKGVFEPWHMSVFEYDGKLYSIIACIINGEKERCWQMLGEFNDDLSSLKIYQTPLTDYKSYRGAAVVDNKGEFILYSTTVHEKLPGSKAVDGRDIIMAHMPFQELLSKLRSEKDNNG